MIFKYSNVKVINIEVDVSKWVIDVKKWLWFFLDILWIGKLSLRDFRKEMF